MWSKKVTNDNNNNDNNNNQPFKGVTKNQEGRIQNNQNRATNFFLGCRKKFFLLKNVEKTIVAEIRTRDWVSVKREISEENVF